MVNSFISFNGFVGRCAYGPVRYEDSSQLHPNMAADAKPVREHHWDFLRAFLMLLGIPYHLLLSYRVGENWIVRSGEGLMAAATAAEFLHLFRMPAFFIIAGYFAALLLARKDAAGWLYGRFIRLGVPLVAALLLLNPVINYICELSNFAPDAAWQSFLHESATSGGYWVRHLWFLIVLLYFSVVAAVAVMMWPRIGRALLPAWVDAFVARHAVSVWLGLAVFMGMWQATAIEAFYEAGLATNIPQQIFRLDEAIQFAPYFLIGCLLARAPMMRQKVLSVSAPVLVPIVLVAGVAAIARLFFMENIAALMSPAAGFMTGRFLSAIAAMGLAQAMFALGYRFMNRPRRWVNRLVAASFVIYLFHMPIIAALVVLGHGIMMPLGVKVALMMVLTFALSYGIWLVVERSRLLSLLFDGRWNAVKPARPNNPTQSSLAVKEPVPARA
ncbi:MAG: hypothetical protein E2598_07350 [Sphingobium sp.]|nr:hypothetical protein [Sphingobium sp.]